MKDICFGAGFFWGNKSLDVSASATSIQTIVVFNLLFVTLLTWWKFPLQWGKDFTHPPKNSWLIQGRNPDLHHHTPKPQLHFITGDKASCYIWPKYSAFLTFHCTFLHVRDNAVEMLLCDDFKVVASGWQSHWRDGGGRRNGDKDWERQKKVRNWSRQQERQSGARSRRACEMEFS